MSANDGLHLDVPVLGGRDGRHRVRARVQDMDGLEEQVNVFISGAMTGHPDFNKEQFDRAEKALHMLGCDVVNPVSFGLENETHERCMLETLRTLVAHSGNDTYIDLVLMLPGWVNSKGARVEYIVASACGIPILDLQHECAS